MIYFQIAFLLITSFYNTNACNSNQKILNGVLESVCLNNRCISCGTSDYESNIKIVGGVEAVPNSWPFHALVQQTYAIDIGGQKQFASYMCGGTLIKNNVILTAGHCLSTSFSFSSGTVEYTPNSYFPTLESTFIITLGLHDRTNPNVAQTFRVSKVLRHPNYNRNTQINDIMLLFLSQNVTLSPYMRTACLPLSSSSYPQVGTVFAVGWGLLKENGVAPSSTLQNVKLNLYEGSVCNIYSSYISSSQICAGDVAGGKDTCQGDSGGGIYMKELDKGVIRNIVTGIVSYGNGCARKNIAGVYTRVSYFVDWINSSI